MEKSSTAFLSCLALFVALLIFYGAENQLAQYSIPALIMLLYLALTTYEFWKYRSECQTEGARSLEWHQERRTFAFGVLMIVLYVTTLFVVLAVFVNTNFDFVHAFVHLSLTTRLIIYAMIALLGICGYCARRMYNTHTSTIVIQSNLQSLHHQNPSTSIQLSSGQVFELVPDYNSPHEAGETTRVLLNDKEAAQSSMPSALSALLRGI